MQQQPIPNPSLSPAVVEAISATIAERPTYRVEFGTLGAEFAPLTIPAPASAADIATEIREHIEAGGYVDVEVEVDLAVGRARISDPMDSALGGADITGPGVGTPDYWLTLADDLRAAADKIATLAGTGRKPNYVHLLINNGSPGNTDPTRAELVDTIAAVFGVTAVSRRSPAGYYEREAITSRGSLRVLAHAYVPAPEDSELARLRAENAQLRARVGGAA